MSLFSLFCCCLRPRSPSISNEPNENTPLIPTSDDVPPAARHIIINQQRMKERLGVIVRAKEGKMVNVNAPLPFNLNSTTTTTNKQSRVSHLRTRTRSPQPSLDMERQSVASSASASASHELDEDMRWPALNVRIIRGGSALARGRPITRDAVTRDPGTGPESGEMGIGVEGEVQPEEAPSEGARPGSRETAARISGSAFKIQNVGSLSRSWGD